MGYRLPPDKQTDLTWFWTEADADMGVCSTGNIEHRGPPPSDVVLAESAVRVRRPKRHELAVRRWATRDEELRLMWHELVCHGDEHVVSIEDPVLPTIGDGPMEAGFERTPMPTWARRVISKDRARASRVHATIQRLVRGHSGPAHERVLYRVYGPVMRHPFCYGRVGSELAPLVEYTEVVARLITPAVTPTEAGERCLAKKGVAESQVSLIKRQADALLVAASKAYAECAERQRDEMAEARAMRVHRLMGVAS
jgi:hypothetical protein